MEIFSRTNRDKISFDVTVTETDSFFIIQKYPTKPVFGGTVDVWISKAQCKVVKEIWGQ